MTAKMSDEDMKLVAEKARNYSRGSYGAEYDAAKTRLPDETEHLATLYYRPLLPLDLEGTVVSDEEKTKILSKLNGVINKIYESVANIHDNGKSALHARNMLLTTMILKTNLSEPSLDSSMLENVIQAEATLYQKHFCESDGKLKSHLNALSALDSIGDKCINLIQSESEIKQITKNTLQANTENVATKGLKNKIKAAVRMGRDAVAKAAEVADKLTPTNDGVTGLIKIPVVLGAVVATAVSTTAVGVYAAATAIRSVISPSVKTTKSHISQGF